MSQPSQSNPLFTGPVKAPSFLMPIVNGLTLKTTITCLSGTTRLPVFAATVDGSNGFSGTFTGVKTIAGPTPASGNVILRSDEGGTVTRVSLPMSGLQGSMNGSATAIAFTLNGCSTIETSTAAVLGSVEIEFTILEVK